MITKKHPPLWATSGMPISMKTLGPRLPKLGLLRDEDDSGFFQKFFRKKKKVDFFQLQFLKKA